MENASIEGIPLTNPALEKCVLKLIFTIFYLEIVAFKISLKYIGRTKSYKFVRNCC